MGAGLEALALGLEVVPVATAAAVDELLTLLAGGVEEEAAEECLAAPADGGQVAEICAVQGEWAEPAMGWGHRRAWCSRGPQRSLHSSGALSLPNPSRWQPALRPPAPCTSSPGAPPLHSVVPPWVCRTRQELGVTPESPLPGCLGSPLLLPSPALTTLPFQSPTATALSPHPAPAPGTCSRTCWGSTWWHRDSWRRWCSGSMRRPCGRCRSPRPAGPPPLGCGSSTQPLLWDTAAGMLGRAAEPGAEQPPSAPGPDPNCPPPCAPADTRHHAEQWEAPGSSGTQSIPVLGTCPRHTHPSLAPLFQLCAGPGQTARRGGAGLRGGGGGSWVAAPWCPGQPGLGPGCGGMGFKVCWWGGGSGAGARAGLIPAMRVTSRTQAGPGLPGGIPAAALELGGPVGRDGCSGAAGGESSWAAAACPVWAGGTAGTCPQPPGDEPAMGMGRGRSVLASPLPVSVVVPCQGTENRQLWHSHQPGKGLGHRTPWCCAPCSPCDAGPQGEAAQESCGGRAPSPLLIPGLTEGIPGRTVTHTGLSPWVPPWLAACPAPGGWSDPRQHRAPGAGPGGRWVPGIPPAPVGGRGVKPAKRREKQIKLFSFSRNNCLPNYCSNYCPNGKRRARKALWGEARKVGPGVGFGGRHRNLPAPHCSFSLPLL